MQATESMRPETKVILEILKCTNCITNENLCKEHSKIVKEILLEEAKTHLEK